MRKRYATVFAVCGLYFIASYVVLSAAFEVQRAALPAVGSAAARIQQLEVLAALLLCAGLICLAAVYTFVWAPLVRAVYAKTAALERAASIDALTGLLNRAAFTERVKAALAGSTRHQRRGALLMIDIDHFKRVNDTFGHAVGDQVQREIGARLIASVRADEFAGRLGGDEYAVMAPNIDAGLDAFVARIRDAVRFTLDLDGTPITISASIGVARFPADGFTIEALLGSADRALYTVKNGGRGGVEFASRVTAIA